MLFRPCLHGLINEVKTLKMLNVVLINTTFDIGLALPLPWHKYTLFIKKIIEITEYAE
jgi:hypothetical protein